MNANPSGGRTPDQDALRTSALSDSQATLRQVDEVLEDFTSQETGSRLRSLIEAVGDGHPEIRELLEILEPAHTQVMAIIDRLRTSRGLLEQAAMERVRTTQSRLSDVSSATEVAATSMLDGLDRSLVLVDSLEEQGSRSEAPEGVRSNAQVREEIREELNNLIGLLQFQDITSQQLGYASGVLLDIEERMTELSHIFDLNRSAGAAAERPRRESHELHFNPGATAVDAGARQALADEIFR